MSTITIEPLGPSVGAEVRGIDPERLLEDADLPAALLKAVEDTGVLVFRGLHLDRETQVAFCKKFGPIETSEGRYEVKGIYLVSLDRATSASADYLYGNFGWHIDGLTPTVTEHPPPMLTMLTAQVVADEGGDTEFASTYAAYDDLSDAEKEAFAGLRVFHTMEAGILRFIPKPTEEHMARFRSQPTKVHPLIWTHQTGKRSLVIGGTSDFIIGMPLEEGRALLSELVERATTPDRVYSHKWQPGDTVLWDNRGLLHHITPFDTSKPREMRRTTVLGQETIQ
jgi:alpha-ketoglutarate-dependent taurine dioxygenase